MRNNGFANILLIVLVVALVGVLGYVILVKNLASNTGNGLLDGRNMPLASTFVVPSPVSLPLFCRDEQEGTPVITSLSSYYGSIGTKLEIKGCNFSGFEGDKTVWIENHLGAKGLLRGETGSTGKLLKIVLTTPLCEKDISYSGLPCETSLTLTPGTYKIYTMPWRKKSNEASFTIK